MRIFPSILRDLEDLGFEDLPEAIGMEVRVLADLLEPLGAERVQKLAMVNRVACVVIHLPEDADPEVPFPRMIGPFNVHIEGVHRHGERVA